MVFILFYKNKYCDHKKGSLLQLVCTELNRIWLLSCTDSTLLLKQYNKIQQKMQAICFCNGKDKLIVLQNMLTLKLKHSIVELDNLCLSKLAKTRTEQKQTYVTVSMYYHKSGLDPLCK